MRGRGLTDVEREEISRGIAAGESGRDVASRLGRHYSVINREVARCGGREGYRSAAAAGLAAERARRPKPHRLAVDPRLHDAVAAGLTEAWSPRRISARLRLEHPDDEAMRVRACQMVCVGTWGSILGSSTSGGSTDAHDPASGS